MNKPCRRLLLATCCLLVVTSVAANLAVRDTHNATAEFDTRNSTTSKLANSTETTIDRRSDGSYEGPSFKSYYHRPEPNYQSDHSHTRYAEASSMPQKTYTKYENHVSSTSSPKNLHLASPLTIVVHSNRQKVPAVKKKPALHQIPAPHQIPPPPASSGETRHSSSQNSQRKSAYTRSYQQPLKYSSSTTQSTVSTANRKYSPSSSHGSGDNDYPKYTSTVHTTSEDYPKYSPSTYSDDSPRYPKYSSSTPASSSSSSSSYKKYNSPDSQNNAEAVIPALMISDNYQAQKTQELLPASTIGMVQSMARNLLIQASVMNQLLPLVQQITSNLPEVLKAKQTKEQTQTVPPPVIPPPPPPEVPKTHIHLGPTYIKPGGSVEHHFVQQPRREENRHNNQDGSRHQSNMDNNYFSDHHTSSSTSRPPEFNPPPRLPPGPPYDHYRPPVRGLIGMSPDMTNNDYHRPRFMESRPPASSSPPPPPQHIVHVVPPQQPPVIRLSLPINVEPYQVRNQESRPNIIEMMSEKHREKEPQVQKELLVIKDNGERERHNGGSLHSTILPLVLQLAKLKQQHQSANKVEGPTVIKVVEVQDNRAKPPPTVIEVVEVKNNQPRVIQVHKQTDNPAPAPPPPPPPRNRPNEPLERFKDFRVLELDEGSPQGNKEPPGFPGSNLHFWNEKAPEAESLARPMKMPSEDGPLVFGNDFTGLQLTDKDFNSGLLTGKPFNSASQLTGKELADVLLTNNNGFFTNNDFFFGKNFDGLFSGKQQNFATEHQEEQKVIRQFPKPDMSPEMTPEMLNILKDAVNKALGEEKGRPIRLPSSLTQASIRRPKMNLPPLPHSMMGALNENGFPQPSQDEIFSFLGDKINQMEMNGGSQDFLKGNMEPKPEASEMLDKLPFMSGHRFPRPGLHGFELHNQGGHGPSLHGADFHNQGGHGPSLHGAEFSNHGGHGPSLHGANFPNHGGPGPFEIGAAASATVHHEETDAMTEEDKMEVHKLRLGQTVSDVPYKMPLHGGRPNLSGFHPLGSHPVPQHLPPPGFGQQHPGPHQFGPHQHMGLHNMGSNPNPFGPHLNGPFNLGM